jgi:hypothetical protein
VAQYGATKHSGYHSFVFGIPGSNLGPELLYSEDVFRDFPQNIMENAGNIILK